ncbi:MAG: hypothetical protein JO211_10855, partial [Acidobacteriaceae bacterium]|nr:hypothetical protein [Acidobacteriaceae bacterium]
ADVALVNNANASTSQTITTKQVEDFPVNGRTPLVLAQLSIGVMPEAQPQQIHPFDNAAAVDFSVAGSKIQTSEVLMDGSPDTTWDMRVAYNPPMDATQQVTMDVFSSDAAYGHTSAGTANQITKSGTNQFHGTLYEFDQNNAFSANNFFSNLNGKPVPTLHYNQYGVTAGAPIILPKLYNGKNKLFFFFAWEGLRDNSPTPTYTSVPTAAERSGDFSALLPLSTSKTNYTIYNPFSATLSSGTITRQPISYNGQRNVIPPSLISPIAQQILNLYPQPNVAGLANGEDNYFVNAASIDNYDNEFGRVDYNVGNNDKVFFDFRHNYRFQNKNNLFSNVATGSTLVRENWGSTLDEVHTFGGSTVLDMRLNWSRMNESHGEPGLGFNPTTLGFPSYLASNSEQLQIPNIAFPNSGSGGFQSLGGTGDNSLPSESYQIFGTLEKVIGNHTLKTGADARRYNLSNITYGAAAGSLTFSTNYTIANNTTATAAPIGQDLAAFLMGLPTSGTYNEASYAYLRNYYYGVFLQDDWRLKSNLTINLGIRFENETAITERYGRLVNGFATTWPNPLSSAVQSAYAANYSSYASSCAGVPAACAPSPASYNVNGGLTFASPGNPDYYATRPIRWSPRLGFSWAPAMFHNKTVVRGGFGIFVSPIDSVALVNLPPTGNISTSPVVDQEGFSQSTSINNNNYLNPNSVTGTPTSTLANPFPTGIAQPTGSSQGLLTFAGQNVMFVNPAMKSPYSERWELGVQQQFASNWLLELAYIGNRSNDLTVNYTELNYIPRQYLSTSTYKDAADTAVSAYLSKAVANPFKGLIPNGSYNGSTVSLYQLLVPYPQFPAPGTSSGALTTSTGVIEQNATAGSSWFNSFNARLEKRLSYGLSLIGNYAYSKLMEQDDYLNDTDTRLEQRVSIFDHPHHISLGFTYDFPIGRGRSLDLHNRLLDAFIGGWVVNGIYQWEIGAPIYFPANLVYCPTPSPACDGYGGPINLNNSNGNGQAFNLQAFDVQSADQPSFNIRTFSTTFSNLRQMNLSNLDASVMKNFNINESTYFQLRFEAFNALNHAVFGAPTVSSATSSSFGLIQTQANGPRSLQLGARFVF